MLVRSGVGRVRLRASYIFPVVYMLWSWIYIEMYFVEANLLQHSMSVGHVWLPGYSF